VIPAFDEHAICRWESTQPLWTDGESGLNWENRSPDQSASADSPFATGFSRGAVGHWDKQPASAGLVVGLQTGWPTTCEFTSCSES
jgi:hypothetical protein